MVKIPKIIISGAGGQLGYALAQELQDFQPKAYRHQEWDITNLQQGAELIQREKPDFIINAAAYTAVDKAESETAQAFAVNAQAPQLLAQQAQQIGACLIHFSTDYVFDGRQKKPQQETDEPAPLSVYGQTKWQGEKFVTQVSSAYYLLRTSWLYGVKGHNFAHTMLRLAREAAPEKPLHKPLRVVADQIGSPTSVALVAKITRQIIQRAATAQPLPYGLYHLSAAGSASWYEYAVFLLQQAGLAKTVQAITTADYPQAAQRPAYSVLDCQKLCNALGVVLPPWQDDVRKFVQSVSQS